MTPGRRVLLLSSLWPPAVVGGAELYAAALADRLVGAGHVVGVVTLGVPGPQVVAQMPPRPHTVEYHRAGSRVAQVMFHLGDVWQPGVHRRLRSAIAAFRPDVVHSHVVTGMSARALATPSRLGVGHVHTVHDHWLRCWRSTGTRQDQRPCGPACRSLATWRALQLRRHHPHVVLGISSDVLERHEHLGRVLERARVLRHPVEDVPARRPRPVGSPPTFGYLGQLNPNKGVPVLLDAAERLGSAAHVVVAGRGVLDQVVAARTGPHVEVLGWVSGAAKADFFERIDCLVVPSVWDEPAGLVVLEAAARGIPVIASAAGGLPEYVPGPCRALLVPPGDAGALADAMGRFAARPEAFDVTGTPLLRWDEHLDEVVRAYDDARALAAGGASRG